MVAKIATGKSIRGVLSYNENKIRNAEAQLLMACGFPRDHQQLSFRNKLDRFAMLTAQNDRTKTNTVHISLNFSRYDQVDDEMMKEIAVEYMDRIGLGDQPFLVYRHYDAAHPHCHIATVNIAEGGQRIETHNIGKNQSEKARKELEEQYGLIKAEDQKKELSFLPRAVDLQKVVYGKQETKAAISSIVREITATYKYTSLPELNAVLRQFNVVADRGEPGSRMYDKKGLVYRLINPQGEKVGLPVKASSIYSSPTLANLEKRFRPNTDERKPLGLRLKHQLDKAMSASKNMEEVVAGLNKQGIRILLRENVQGNIYGITLVDNATRCVFNGSDLGKAYSAKALLDSLERNGFKKGRDYRSEDQPDNATAPDNTGWKKPSGVDFPASNESVIATLADIAVSGTYDESVPNPFKKKKKKRLEFE